MALVFRGTSYYYRRRVPKDISIHIGLVEVCRSLKTMSRPEAWLRAAVFDKKFDEVCKMARGENIDNLTREDVESIVHRFRSRCFYELEEQIIDPPSEPSEFEREMAEDYARDEGQRAQRELMYNEQAEVDEQARELLTEMNMKPDPLSYEYKLLRHRLLETRAELALVYFNALRGDVKGLRAGLNGGVAGVLNAASSTVAPKLSVLIEDYKEFKVASKDWRLKTERESMQKLAVMLKFFTDKPIDMIDKKKANNFHNLLNALPVNFMKHMDKVPLKQLADKNKKFKGKTLAGKTVYDKYISAVKSFFTWAEDNDCVTKSPFSHIRGTAGKSKAQDDRKPLNDEDLKIAFNAEFTIAAVPKWTVNNSYKTQ